MGVRILLLSDLHLEDLDHEAWRPDAATEFDVLVCAGDVVESDPAACVDVVSRIAAGKPAVLVLGNHDVWNLTLQGALAIARARNPGVTVLEGGGSVTIEGVTFAGGTLWDDPDAWPIGIPRVKATDATQSGEPVYVEAGGIRRHATFKDLAEVHSDTVAMIARAAPDVVLTHYPPSAADLASLVSPAVWLHGHIHTIQNERAGMHHLVRVPCRRDINLLGAAVRLDGIGRTPRVEPVVGVGRFARKLRDRTFLTDAPGRMDQSE